MPLLLKIGQLEFRKALFRNKFFVKDRATNQVRYATPEMLMKFNELVAAIKASELTVEGKAFAVEYLAARFMATVMEPDALPAQIFLTASTQTFLGAVDLAMLGWTPNSSA